MREVDNQIDYWVNKAHNIFNKTSIFEVVDLDNKLAKKFLNEVYGNPKNLACRSVFGFSQEDYYGFERTETACKRVAKGEGIR